MQPRAVPVLPHAAGLAGGRHAVAGSREEEASLPRHLGLEGEGRHDAVDGDGVGPEGAVLLGPATHRARGMTAVEVDEVGGGDAGDGARQAVLEGGGEGGDVAAEGQAADGRSLGACHLDTRQGLHSAFCVGWYASRLQPSGLS